MHVGGVEVEQAHGIFRSLKVTWTLGGTAGLRCTGRKVWLRRGVDVGGNLVGVLEVLLLVNSSAA